MSNLPRDDGAGDLQGIGSSLKKAVKQVAAVHKQAVTVMKAVVAPTSSNVEKATEAAKPYVPLLLNTVGNVLAPGVGSTLAAGWNAARAKIEAKKMVSRQNAEGVTEYFDSEGKPITKDQYDAIMALAATAPADSEPTLTINAGTIATPTAASTATSADAKLEEFKAQAKKWALRGSLGLLVVGLGLKAYSNSGNRGAARGESVK